MAVITLSRQMGSGGNDIAQAVAARLGLRLVGREVINQAARQAGVPEVALAEIDELGLLGMRPRPQALGQYRQTVARLINDLADAGNLMLVGRGGQVVLAGRPGVLHVRVIATRVLRVARVQAECHVTPEGAAALVDRADEARAAYFRRHYHVRWDDPALYGLTLNMAQLSVTTAVEVVCVAARQYALQGTEKSA